MPFFWSNQKKEPVSGTSEVAPRLAEIARIPRSRREFIQPDPDRRSLKRDGSAGERQALEASRWIDPEDLDVLLHIAPCHYAPTTRIIHRAKRSRSLRIKCARTVPMPLEMSGDARDRRRQRCGGVRGRQRLQVQAPLNEHMHATLNFTCKRRSTTHGSRAPRRRLSLTSSCPRIVLVQRLPRLTLVLPRTCWPWERISRWTKPRRDRPEFVPERLATPRATPASSSPPMNHPGKALTIPG